MDKFLYLEVDGWKILSEGDKYSGKLNYQDQKVRSIIPCKNRWSVVPSVQNPIMSCLVIE